MKLHALLGKAEVAGLAEAFASHTATGHGRADQDIEIAGITADSRTVGPGFLFVALKGTAADGARFIPDAVKAGAAAILTHSAAGLDGVSVPAARLDDPRLALSRLAAAFYPKQPEIMVAVTGTAGKTSIASFTRQIWEKAGRAAASIGTTGVVAPGRDTYGSLTTPDPIHLHRLLQELAEAGVTHGAMEASSHGLDQYRLDGVRLAAAGFTNLGRDHMDYHPTVEHYFSSKMRLFRDLLPKGAPAVIFADDPWSERTAEVVRGAGGDLLTVGRKGDYISLKRVEHERFGQIAEVSHGSSHYRIEFPMAGDFQIANALVSAGLAIATGSDPAATFKALETLKGASGRLELVGYSASHAPCYVDYAHKPEALENVLTSLRPFTTGKLVCVFGCGGDRDPGKRPIMGEIASRLADRVVVTDDNPRSEEPAAIRAAIMAAAPGATEIGDRAEAIGEAVAMLGTGDCLVIAGKGHETGQTIGGITHPFSDHAVLRAALAGAGGRMA
ncbi:MAG: UDP-N-acetylmuramoyl-L-alanyl-D-glutamate--2,6-diaminopimelate ligase [Nitratireductor sp.]|nr:UDP-N-acetylmuramoyl-L-alanyl-D-glutamate--2,6-diaminopimelate ligase [Nitratireductor sp.]